MRKCYGYVPERRFVRVLLEMTKNLGQWGGGGFLAHLSFVKHNLFTNNRRIATDNNNSV